jgi:hypothetical protein
MSVLPRGSWLTGAEIIAKPENDDPYIIEPIEVATGVA